MLSKQDKHYLNKTFATKKELKELKEEVHTISDKLDNFIIYSEKTFATKEEMFTRFDAVMFELKAIREDMAAMFFRQKENTDILNTHELRITDLESKYHS